MAEDDRAVVLDVIIEPDAIASLGQNIGQCRLADFERIVAQVVAVQLDQVEGVQEHAVIVAPVAMRLKLGNPLSSQATASPSMMQEFDRRCANASTIRQVRSLPGRL